MRTEIYKQRRRRRILFLLIFTGLIIYTAHKVIVHYAYLLIHERVINFKDEASPVNPTEARSPELAMEDAAAPIMPMEEIHPFDEDAKNWSTVFGMYHSGVTVFDANGDNRPDIYFCQDGQNWARPTDDGGLLTESPRYQHNALYLHMGYDENRHPLYKQISERVKTNDLFIKEELLVENYLFPREHVGDSEQRYGRQSVVAVAADFNADGRPDLLVGNGLYGMWWSHPKTQRVLFPFVSPTGREARHSKRELAGLGTALIRYKPRNNTDDFRSSSRGEEPFGANSLFINLGDRDHDGIPEWKDMSREAGIEGKRSTYALSIADIDLDGDLDIFEANAMDFDFWPGAAKGWAGGGNQLYINQLAETGHLRFKEKAGAMDVDGVFDEENPMITHNKLRRIPWLPKAYSFLFLKLVPYQPSILTIEGQEGDPGQISWSSFFQDVNDDGYPDLWVADDFTNLKLYINQQGTHFKKWDNARSDTMGNWMSFAPADFNGDLAEDLFIGNTGGGGYANSFINPDPLLMFDPAIADGAFFSLNINGSFDTRHAFIDGRDPMRAMENKIFHSTVLPPDTSLPNNIRIVKLPSGFIPRFNPSTIDPYEFVWGSVALDIQNDSRMDLYIVGNMIGRGGGIFSLGTTNPGRLLVNEAPPKASLQFRDLTAEHHLFNMNELHYDKLKEEGYIYRKAPLQNWGKRDEVFSYDRSIWTSEGRQIQEKVTNHDMIQLAENGQCALDADLNQDGFVDLIVRNVGGYDTRSSKGRNLKGKTVTGKIAVLSSHNNNYPLLTNYDPGNSRVFINTYQSNHWLKLRLIDNDQGALNRDALGAKVIVNQKHLRIKRASQGSHIANKLTDMHFGLGQEVVKEITIHWPDKERSQTHLTLDNFKNGLLIVTKNKGLVSAQR